VGKTGGSEETFFRLRPPPSISPSVLLLLVGVDEAEEGGLLYESPPHRFPSSVFG
jgi:hypothetical protein